MKKKKPTKPQSFLLKNDVYPVFVMVSLGETGLQFKRSVERHLKLTGVPLNAITGGERGRALNNGDGKYMLYLKDYPDCPVTHSVVAHEAVHVANYISDFLGLPINVQGDEVQAYLVSWLTREIYQRARR